MTIIFVFLFSWSISSPAVKPVYDDDTMVDFLIEYLSIKYSSIEFNDFLYVAAKRQKLFHIKNKAIVATYDISTSKKGLGNQQGTFCTPSGLHEIADKAGANLAEGSILKNKLPTGEIASVITASKSSGEDLVTTRILHLRGLEENVNRGGENDSYSRGIFIHGTHEEGLLGTPASKGCVRMANRDVAELFEKVEVGTFVVILNN